MNLQKIKKGEGIIDNEDDPPESYLFASDHFRVDVVCKNDRWTKAQKNHACQAARAAFSFAKKNKLFMMPTSLIPISPMPISMTPISMTLVFADGAFVQTLNARFRRQNSMTNVLAFPAGEPALLGDVIIALDVLQQEAAEKKITLLAHLAHLAAHGTLHLLGFDHNDDENAERMEAIEVSILGKMGISNPYCFHEKGLS